MPKYAGAAYAPATNTTRQDLRADPINLLVAECDLADMLDKFVKHGAGKVDIHHL
tara:strand:- start:153 stop:317 length:165 start_codon:yes stop_codon:yes gene_type:complete